MEQDVDRLIDSEGNDYVISRSKDGFSLTLDPLLIQARAHFGWQPQLCVLTHQLAQPLGCKQILIAWGPGTPSMHVCKSLQSNSKRLKSARTLHGALTPPL